MPANLLNNQTTMIGSMPQKDAKSAIAALNKYPLSIPAWPQLPKRSFKEAMVPQYCEGFPGIKIDETARKIWVENNDDLLESMALFYENVVDEKLEAFSITPEFAAGFHQFMDDMERKDKKPDIVKGQVTGPFTFGLSLAENDGKPVWFDEQYKDIVLKGLAMKARWQIRQLKKISDKVILFFDEPILSALGTPAYMGIEDSDVISGLNEVIEAVKSEDAVCGIHCCGNMDWGLLSETDIDVIAFDAFFFGDKLPLYPEAINRFLNRGGYLAYGIVPTSSSSGAAPEFDALPVNLLKDKVDGIIKQFIDKGVSEELAKTRILYTPSCGMGTLSEDNTDKVLELLSGLRG